MKIRKLFIVLFSVMFLFLAGCSTLNPKEFAQENNVAPTDNSQVIECYKWMKEKEAAERAEYEKLTVADKVFALMHRETMSMVKSVWGKESNVCKPGTNEWDAYIAYVQETEASKRVYAKEIGSTARLASGVAGGVLAVKEIGNIAGDRIAGDKTVSGRDAINTEKGNIGLDGNKNDQRTTTEVNTQVTRGGTATIQPKAEETQALPAVEPAEPVVE